MFVALRQIIFYSVPHIRETRSPLELVLVIETFATLKVIHLPIDIML